MAEHQLTCAGCSAQFSYHRRKKYCTPRCRPGYGYTGRDRNENAACRQEHECSWCGVRFKPKQADRNKYCSRDCYLERKRAEGIVHKAFGRVLVRKHIPRKSIRVYDQPREPERCFACGAGYYRAAKYQRYCTKECGEAHRRVAVKKGRRIAKAQRKARERGASAGEYLDPIKVFERDAWRCGLCGKRTPRAKRGSLDPKAPELDHIVSLANGGTHTWDNVQCSCRACNSAKGAKSYGQIPMFPKGYGGMPKL